MTNFPFFPDVIQYRKRRDTHAGYDPARIAVEINGEIVPKSAYDEKLFCDGDVVEVVSFVGGG